MINTKRVYSSCLRVSFIGVFLLIIMFFLSLEMFGGATFDSMMRFLNEDPWERLETLRDVMPKTCLQMLLRAQNVIG